MIYLDTHVAVWLYDGQLERFSGTVRSLFENNDMLISPMAVLELHYLYETGRITVPAKKMFHELSIKIDLKECLLPFSSIVLQAQSISWTRDPFDRIITAHAMEGNAALVTKDAHILKNYKKALWD